MKRRYFTVGPAAIYPRLAEWSNQYYKKGLASISHRSVEFEDLYRYLDEQLRVLMDIPSTHSIFIASSGSEVMERILQNSVRRGSFHFINGSFSEKFYKYSKRFNHYTEKIELEYGLGFSQIPDIGDKIDLICMTHNETSMGIKTSEDYIHEVKRRYPQKILAVDVVSSAPLVNLDFSLVDICFFSSQKAFGLPAGLGIWIINSNLAEQLAGQKSYTGKASHNILEDYVKNYKKFQTPSTPNTLGVFLMGKVAEDMKKLGRTKLISNMMEKKKKYHNLFTNNDYLKLVNSSEFSSDTVIVTKYIRDKKEVDELLTMNYIIPSNGYSNFKKTQLRFANFPSNSLEDIEFLSKALLKIVRN